MNDSSRGQNDIGIEFQALSLCHPADVFALSLKMLRLINVAFSMEFSSRFCR